MDVFILGYLPATIMIREVHYCWVSGLFEVEVKTLYLRFLQIIFFFLHLQTTLQIFWSEGSATHNTQKLNTFSLKDDYLDQILWIFGKLPNGLRPPQGPPPTLFSENYVALFATKFFGVQRPHPISLPKKRNKIFRIGNDLLPPLRKFSENSSNLVQVVFPKTNSQIRDKRHCQSFLWSIQFNSLLFCQCFNYGSTYPCHCPDCSWCPSSAYRCVSPEIRFLL